MNVPTMKLIKRLVLLIGLIAAPLSYAGTDLDGIPDDSDNCPTVANPDQADFDGDGRGDACDADDDADGVIDQLDPFPFNPNYSADTDGDGLPDSYETSIGLDPEVDDASDDEDEDNLTNYEEFEAQTDPFNSDTDYDTLPDGYEVNNRRDPLIADYQLYGEWSGGGNCLLDRKQNLLCGEGNEAQFSGLVSNVKRVERSLFCGIASGSIECVGEFERVSNAFSNAYTEARSALVDYEVQDFLFYQNAPICMLLSEPAKVVCVDSDGVLDRDGDGDDDLQDPCPSARDNSLCTVDRSGHDRLALGYDSYLFSGDRRVESNISRPEDLILSYDSSKDAIVSAGVSSCATNTLVQEWDLQHVFSDREPVVGESVTCIGDQKFPDLTFLNGAASVRNLATFNRGYGINDILCALTSDGVFSCGLKVSGKYPQVENVVASNGNALLTSSGIEHFNPYDEFDYQIEVDSASLFAGGVIEAAGQCIWFAGVEGAYCFGYDPNDQLSWIRGKPLPDDIKYLNSTELCILYATQIFCRTRNSAGGPNSDLVFTFTVPEGHEYVGTVLRAFSSGNTVYPLSVFEDGETGEQVVAKPNGYNPQIPSWLSEQLGSIVDITASGCVLTVSTVVCESDPNVSGLPELLNPTKVAAYTSNAVIGGSRAKVCVIEQRGVFCSHRQMPLITDATDLVFTNGSNVDICVTRSSGDIQCYDSTAELVYESSDLEQVVTYRGNYNESPCGIFGGQLRCSGDYGEFTFNKVVGEYSFDPDGDGVPNYKPDLYPFNSAESGDFDGDGIGDNEDTDDDSDGIPDDEDPYPLDTDNDGLNNDVDEDDDSDGLNDDVDPAPLDTDNDGLNNDVDSDDDGDGVDDVDDQLPLDPTGYLDNDGDGISDPVDPDDDNDGLDDEFDEFPFDPNEQVDSDGDGVGNNADAFPFDETETSDTDGDGVGDNSDAFPEDPDETIDTDGDGVGDNGDAFPNDASETVDSDGDGVGDNADAFPNDASETRDTDGDGLGNNADLDDDGDGLADTDEAQLGTDPLNADTDRDGVNDGQDAFPTDPSETTDSDGDGVGNNGDAFPFDSSETQDSDSDGVGDNADAFPNDASETIDTDSDGVGNNADPDDDGDGLSDIDEVNLGTDPLLSDTDSDGTDDGQDAFPNDASEDTDSDSDGVGDNADVFPNDPSETQDSDGDGVGDNSDAFPGNPNETLDTDSDGIGNNADSDDDGDGVNDAQDAFPLDPSETADTDADGVGNNADADDDNDGILDGDDAFPLDASETIDTDGDGTGNNADTDDDGDGLSDNQEIEIGTDPLLRDSDEDGVDDGGDAFPTDNSETTDSDGDGVGDNADAFPNDSTETTDTDGDGVGDNGDAFPNDASETSDNDSDGLGDNADNDDDNDGYADNVDAFPLDADENTDTDGDGLGNNEDTDDDGDGFSDADELSAGTDPLNESSYPVVEEDTSGMPIWLYYITTQLDSAAKQEN